MQGEWHVNKKGDAERCRAKTAVGCPFKAEDGGIGHYNTQKDAQRAFEAQQDQKITFFNKAQIAETSSNPAELLAASKNASDKVAKALFKNPNATP